MKEPSEAAMTNEISEEAKLASRKLLPYCNTDGPSQTKASKIIHRACTTHTERSTAELRKELDHARNQRDEFQKLFIQASDAFTERDQQLASCQTECSEMRDAIKRNHVWHQTYDDHDGYPDSELCNVNVRALSVSCGKVVEKELDRLRAAAREIVDGYAGILLAVESMDDDLPLTIKAKHIKALKLTLASGD